MRSLFLLPLLVLLVVAAPALAEEPADEDSPAAKAYRDAWWLETGSGDLKRALELYETALGLEGSAHVKARALFRRAMVLERVGKTEDAIKTFERLMKAHPDETDLHAQARKHMDAWTSGNLKDTFDDWYDRYQFSPEFQAKVVDLVLRLGSKSAKDGYAAEENELLNIGKAAVPALRRHLDTSNAQLRDRVTAVLLQLGEVPPVETLLGSQLWWSRPKAWTTLLTISPEKAAPIRERASKGDKTLQVIEVATHGPDAALALFLEPMGDDFRRRMGSRLLEAILERPGGVPSVARLDRFITEAKAAGTPELDNWARRVLESLVERGEASDALLLDVLRHGPARTRAVVTSRIQRGLWRHPDAWRAVTEAVLEDPSLLASNYALQDAFFKAVGQAGVANLEPAARAFAKGVLANGNLNARPTTQYPVEDHRRGLERLVPAVLASIPDETVRRKAIQAYGSTDKQLGPGGLDAWMQLFGWARDLPSVESRTIAAYTAGWNVRASSLARALPRLSELEPVAVEHVLRGLERGADAKSLDWNVDAVRVVLRELGRVQAANVASHEPVLRTLVRSEAGAIRVADVMLEDPTAKTYRPHWQQPTRAEPRVHRHVRASLRKGWGGWSPAQREAAITLVRGLVGYLEPDAPFVAWLREELRVPVDEDAEDVGRRLRLALLGLLPVLQAEDLRAALSLDDPAQAIFAALLPRVLGTPEMYDAIREARLHPDADLRKRFWKRWMALAQSNPGGEPASRVVHQAVYRDMLSDPEASNREAAVQALEFWRDLADVPRFVKALDDESPRVRQSAAAALAKVYDRSAIQALAGHLEDSDMNVRETILATLEAIKKAEEAKDYWKTFAEER